jgi:hypothetical protein
MKPTGDEMDFHEWSVVVLALLLMVTLGWLAVELNEPTSAILMIEGR